VAELDEVVPEGAMQLGALWPGELGRGMTVLPSSLLQMLATSVTIWLRLRELQNMPGER